MLNQIKKIYRSLRSEKPTCNRLAIHKAKWFNNSDSPVMLMIDDFSNAWHSQNGYERADFWGDWGGMLSADGSSFIFLKENLLRKYPQVKTVFFAILGKIGPFIRTAPFTFSEAFDHSAESKTFIKKIQFNCGFEIAYHGYQHGIPGRNKEDFVQEWESFSTLAKAVAKNNKGRELYKSILGKYPEGGKYGGWRYNDNADSSISESGFLWWCRDWMPRDTDGSIVDEYYELKYFGDSFVVAIPSTIHGRHWRKKQVDTLLRKRQVISIEEHIGKLKPGCQDQTPNIFDDIEELNKLFAYLKKKNVWYATGTEIATYFIGYTNSIIYDQKENSFKIEYNGRVSNPVITLFVDCGCLCNDKKPFIEVVLPNGAILARQQHVYNKKNYVHKIHVPVQRGEYRLRPVSQPPPILNGEIRGNKIVYESKGLAGHVKLPLTSANEIFLLYEKKHGHFDYLKCDNTRSFHLFCLDSSKDQLVKAV